MNRTGLAVLGCAPVARRTDRPAPGQSSEGEGDIEQSSGFLRPAELLAPFTQAQTDANVSENVAQSCADRGGLFRPQKHFILSPASSSSEWREWRERVRTHFFTLAERGWGQTEPATAGTRGGGRGSTACATDSSCCALRTGQRVQWLWGRHTWGLEKTAAGLAQWEASRETSDLFRSTKA